MNILFASSEVFPLIKTGGLADVSAGLPLALQKSGQDVRIVMPGYPQALARGGRLQTVAEFEQDFPGRLLQGRLPGSRLPVWFVDIPEYFQRAGGPYATAGGLDWPDNAERFAAFSRVVCRLAQNRLGLDWPVDIVHANDWQTGLVPALLSREKTRPASVFTIHNLAYQGLFPWETFNRLKLPQELWSVDGLEFHGRLSLLKGGLVFADQLTTVSPSYAKEIQTPQFGYGLEGLLRHRAKDLHGILNGVDYRQWNPARDPHLAANYSRTRPQGKRTNKQALQQCFGLPQNAHIALVGMVGRMVEQKGFDLVLHALPWLLQQPLQLVILGSGDKRLESELLAAGRRHPERIGVKIGYDEALAHLLEAGADIFLMPSRFEPCGLNQIYSQRYGTVPVVHRTGGLIDSVVDTTPETLAAGTATGFHFSPAEPEPLAQAMARAVEYYQQPEYWHRLVDAGMRADFSWQRSAAQYLALYETLRETAAKQPGQPNPQKR